MLASTTPSDRRILWLGLAYLALSWGVIILAFHFGLGWP